MTLFTNAVAVGRRGWLHHLVALWLTIVIPSAVGLNTTYSDSDPALKWSPIVCSVPQGSICPGQWWVSMRQNTVHTTDTPGNFVQLAFQGSEVYWYTTLFNLGAVAGVVVDSDPSTSIPTYSANTVFRYNAFSRAGLDPTKQHVITITYLSPATGSFLDIDSFAVISPDQTASSISSTSSSSSPTKSPLPTQAVPIGTIVGAAVGGFAAVILVAVLIFILCRRRRRVRKVEDSYSLTSPVATHNLGQPDQLPATYEPTPYRYGSMAYDHHAQPATSHSELPPVPFQSTLSATSHPELQPVPFQYIVPARPPIDTKSRSDWSLGQTQINAQTPVTAGPIARSDGSSSGRQYETESSAPDDSAGVSSRRAQDRGANPIMGHDEMAQIADMVAERLRNQPPPEYH